MRRELWKFLPALPNTEVVECLLGWLERGPRADFGGVAGSLSAIARHHPEIRQDRRDFATPGTAFTDFEITRRWTIEEYGRLIAPRIRALTAHEEPPYVMPWVADRWGVDVSGVAPGSFESLPEAG